MSEKPKGVYVPIDVLITDDEDIITVGMFGFALYVSGLAYSKRKKTDGFLPKVILSHLLIAPTLDDFEALPLVVERLCAAGLWIEEDKGYRIRSWNAWNPVGEDREAWAERKRRQRERASRNGHAPEARVVTPAVTTGVPPESRLEVEGKGREGKGSTPEREIARRQRDPGFDALAEATGLDLESMTKREARACGVALAEIRKASLDVDAQELRRRATNYATHFPGTITPNALASHWSRCDRPSTAGRGKVANPGLRDAELSERMRAEGR